MFDPDNKKKSGRILIACCVIFVVLFAIINVSAIASFFSAIFSVLSPILIGAGIAYMLNPILKLYEFKVFKKIKKKSVCRGLSLAMTFLTTILLIIFFIYLLIPSLIESIATLVGKMDEYLATATDWINKLINRFAKHEEFRQYIHEDALIDGITNAFSASGSLFETILGYVKTIGLGLVTGLKNLILAIFIAIYMLISKERIGAQFRKLTTAVLPGKARLTLRRYLRLANHTFGDYFIGVLIDACFVMILSLFIFLIFGIPHALFISVIIGVTNIIPIFGPFIGGIPSFLIVFLADPKKALVFLVLLLLIQQIEGNVIAPKILGNSTKLSSLGVIIAITIMGAYFGLVGMIVGVPLFSMIVSIGKELIDSRLKKNDLPTDTASYYTVDSMVDPHEHHERFGKKIVLSITYAIKAIARVFRRLFKKIKTLIQKMKKSTAESEASATESKPENPTNESDKEKQA